MGLVFVSWRTAPSWSLSFLAFGLLGLWASTIETLALISAAVVIALLIGIPLGILAGRSDRFLRLVSPILDFMQIMPTFAYLAPLTLIFLIGPAAATVATLIYAVPPAIRITALGIRGVGHETVEAAESLGSTRLQVLLKVQLPMARSTIGLAVNQTIMMALSMIVITALIDAPGLGQNILKALQKLNVGRGVRGRPGDRPPGDGPRSADRPGQSGQRSAPARPRPGRDPTAGATWSSRRGSSAIALVVGGIVFAAGQDFPEDWRFSFAKPVNDVVSWIETNLLPGHRRR